MIRKSAVFLFLLISVSLQAQVLRNLNYRYLYNPDEAFTLSWEVVKENSGFTAFYELRINDTTRSFSDLKIQWELRKSNSEKSGAPVNGTTTELENKAYRRTGFIKFTEASEQTILTAKVTLAENKKNWAFYFHKTLPKTESIFATTNQEIITNSFITRGKPVLLHGFTGAGPIQVSYYEDAFPAAAPTFSTAQARVAKLIKPDSIFFIDQQATLNLTKKGLYLAQQDTASAQGVAFRVEDDYPKLGKLQSLAGPLVYICTEQEFNKIKSAGSDKKKFDQVILSITGNTERARTFMRNYFKRVESANQYFSSYKEGWKTDRGMVYIIYGIPDEVYLFDDREVWEYSNDEFKERFQFVKSATIFDPENYVLIRERKFKDNWYNTIDLWRKVRF